MLVQRLIGDPADRFRFMYAGNDIVDMKAEQYEHPPSEEAEFLTLVYEWEEVPCTVINTVTHSPCICACRFQP